MEKETSHNETDTCEKEFPLISSVHVSLVQGNLILDMNHIRRKWF